LDVETGQPGGAAGQEREGQQLSGALQVVQRESAHHAAAGDEHHAPDVRENGRSDAEADDVCERIEFAPEFAGGIRHARDAAVQSVEDHGKPDRLGGNFEILLCQIGMCGEIQRALNRAHDRQVTEKDIARREQGRQRVGGARRWPLHRGRVSDRRLVQV